MPKLIFDIETIGEDFDSLDETTQESLTRWIKKEAGDEDDYRKSLDDLKNNLGFSPLTGEIVAIGILEYEKNSGAVYFQAPGENAENQIFGAESDKSLSVAEEIQEGNFKLCVKTEKEMLEKFWEIANYFNEFVSFNGRGFDVPFLMLRSAMHKIKPTKDLMSNRYLNYQKFEAIHVDLLDQFTFYGAVRRRGNLHLWTRAFGIKSPKAEGITGDDVGKMFKEKKFKEIAKYNTGDLIATKELYDYWQNYLKL